jgi:hypothetical protein
MKAQDFDPNDERLRRVLQQWPVKAALPPRFQEGVWRRIERGEAQVPAWLLWLRQLTAAVARPSVAASYLTLLLMAGILAGYWQARVANARADEMLSARYVQVLDPYQNSHH